MRHLAQLDLELALEAALAAQAAAIAAAAGAAGEVRLEGSAAQVIWRSPALRRREFGTPGTPPQPVPGRVAVAHGTLAAEAIGAAAADALRGH